MAPAETSWEEIGARITEARKVSGLSQEQLGSSIGLDRSAVSRIESGTRKVDSLELSRIAARVGRPIDWFIRPRPPTVISRREAQGDARTSDLVLEDLVSDVELLCEIGALKIPEGDRRPGRSRLSSVQDAERLAERAREEARIESGPLVDMLATADSLGLLVFVLDLPGGDFDGSYVSLSELGVALIRAGMEAGRRRFTIAHELGHHCLQDEFDTVVEAPASRSRREKLVDAFAIHLLMPRRHVTRRFTELTGSGLGTRAATLHIGQEYGVSWSALCAHLTNIGLISTAERRLVADEIPSRADFLEQGLQLRASRPAPVLSGRFSSAVLGAYRSRKLSAERAVQMLRGALTQEELPVLVPVPLDALRGEIESSV